MAKENTSSSTKRGNPFLDYKLRNLPYTTKSAENKDGIIYEYPYFQSGSGLQEQWMHKFQKYLTKIGMTKKQAIEIWHNRTGIPKSRATNLLSQTTRQMGIWELELLSKTFNIKLGFDFDTEHRFTYQVEDNKLILECRYFPNFYVRMDMKDFYDFDLEYVKGFHEIEMQRPRMQKLFMDLLKFYFIDTAKKNKLPFYSPKMKELFMQKFTEQFPMKIK